MDDSMEIKSKFLVFLPCAVAPLSIIGSVLTLVSVARARNSSKGRTTYHRLFVGIAISDIISSIGQGLGPFPIPASTGFHGAQGTMATCTLQGFLPTLGLASFAYGTMLMIYFLVVIRFNLSDSLIEKRVEPFLHAMPILSYLAVAIAGLFLLVYNPTPVSCWVSVWPVGCDRNPFVDCTRGGIDGELSLFVRDYFLVIPLIIFTFLSILILLVVAATVAAQYQRIRRYVYRRDTIARANQSENLRQVIVQCLLYGLFFTNCLIWRTMRPIFQWAGKEYDFFDKHYWISVLGVLFFPLQGLFNFLIFIRPRYLKVRSRRYQNNSNDEEVDDASSSRWRAFQEALWYPEGRSQRSSGFAAGDRGRSSRGGSSSDKSTGSLRLWRRDGNNNQEGDRNNIAGGADSKSAELDGGGTATDNSGGAAVTSSDLFVVEEQRSESPPVESAPTSKL